MKPTTDDVIKWAREAGIAFQTYEGITGKNNTVTRGSQPIEHVEMVATLAYAAGAAAMKERAAKVCEGIQDAVDRHKWPNGYQCAAAIRALGDDDA